MLPRLCGGSETSDERGPKACSGPCSEASAKLYMQEVEGLGDMREWFAPEFVGLINNCGPGGHDPGPDQILVPSVR